MEKIINWMVAWSSWTWLWRIESTCYQRKSTVLDVYNQWIQNTMPRLVIKDQNCRTCSGVIQQPCMVMCQKGKMMLKMIKGAMSLSPIALRTLSTVEKRQTKVINMCIVPVNDAKNVLTYAMLDNCSQGSLIQEAIVKKTQTSGKKTTLNLKILNSERSESTTAIEGLEVARSRDANWCQWHEGFGAPEGHCKQWRTLCIPNTSGMVHRWTHK